eukprot:COSAG01_NODE_3115_length_6565_cov_23.371172_4_plen_313_part_00
MRESERAEACVLCLECPACVCGSTETGLPGCDPAAGSQWRVVGGAALGDDCCLLPAAIIPTRIPHRTTDNLTMGISVASPDQGLSADEAKEARRRRLGTLGLAGVLVLGAKVGLPALRRLFPANPAVRMVGAAAEAAAAPVAEGTFDASKSLVGPLLTKFLQIAPMVTCQLVAVSAWKMCSDIKRVKSTATLNPMPFTAMLTNSVVWGLYGFGKRDYTMLTPQLLSFFLGAYYTAVFGKYSKKGSEEAGTLKKHCVVGGLMSAVTLGLATFRPLDAPSAPLRSYETCGWIGVASSILLSIGPGATIFRVLAS